MNRPDPTRLPSCFTLSVLLGFAGAVSLHAQVTVPEPAGWYSGDMHVHRSCGSSPVPVSTIMDGANTNNLAVISLLADSGNGEVQDAPADLPRVNGQDDPASTTDRIIHWDSEWHWDPTFTNYPFHALGGHIVLLGLNHAEQLFEEYTFRVLDYAHQQNAIAGFAHFQYLGDSFPTSLSCCTPFEYPVEVALGACDFISEDVAGSDAAVRAYYRLLNCGFRPGWAGGSDYPCGADIGDVLTYVQVPGTLTYRAWIDGIKNGRTVVSRNAHREFLDLQVDNTAGPGDEIALPAGGGDVSIKVDWTAAQALSGTIEVVRNGIVVASLGANAGPGAPATLTTTISVPESSWIAARRMSTRGHEVQTAAVFVTVGGAPIRASADDANYYVDWIDQLIARTSPGGPWNYLFPTKLAEVQQRYQAARAVFQQRALEATPRQPLLIDATGIGGGTIGRSYSGSFIATGGLSPYTWSVSSGALPDGLALNSATGALNGTPTVAGTFQWNIRVSDSSSPVQTATQSVSVGISTPSSDQSVWSANPTPGTPDGGADASVELGLKFTADVSGTITGIRFYKASANVGPHTGSLWSAAGTQLATGTFQNETASGWQTLVFATPVSITANTVYVASYHSPAGHYSADSGFLASHGVDAAPLHVPADGVSGPNGIFRYGSTAIFPNQPSSGTNYWVDVTFRADPPPSLDSITLSPTSATLPVGGVQAFTATGHYSDGTTRDISSEVTWASSASACATVSTSGLAQAVAPGSATVTASVNTISGSATVTVQPAPLSISTAALPAGTIGSAYSATLAAVGGVPAYTWSIASGALPAGLSLDPATGAIGGTPTSSGQFTVSFQVTDHATPPQNATKSLSLSVSAAPAGSTVWSASTVPTLADAGPDAAVELGVKFRSDVAGYVTGIRFYKSAANTGTHVGELWSATGTLLASGTFASETNSGWQTLTFATPVSITANTVYIAAYHCPAGHYSADLGYFNGRGIDNGSLHALADGVSGSNGVFRIGPAGSFPNQAYNATNYWVDLVFQPQVTRTLTSITLAPQNPTATVGGSVPFAATATYSDGTSSDVTSQVTWSSSNQTCAAIGASGSALALFPGTTTISAALGATTDSTTLTVQPGPLTITTSSLPAGTVNSAYTAALAAVSGTAPYSWSLSAGTLPPGLTLNPTTGAITGIPTTAGSSNFTARVTDSASPAQSASRDLSITVAAAPSGVTAWSAGTVPGTLDGGPDSPVELGVKFRSDVDGFVTAVRFYKGPQNTGAHTGSLWSVSGTLLASGSFSNESASGWQQLNFATPVPITAGTVYVASYHSVNGHYSADSGFFSGHGVDAPPLHLLATGVSGANGVYRYGTTSSFPTDSYNASNYWVDVVFEAGPPPALTSIALLPANPATGVGTTVQFSATGTYTNGSSQDITSQVTWTSSNAAAATISASGLAFGLASGSTTITASLGGHTAATTLTVQATPLSVTTSSLSGGSVGSSYSATLAAVGGTLPYTWTLSNGALPAGLALNAATGVIAGTPTAAGTFNFSVQVADAAVPSQLATKPLSLVVAAASTTVTLWSASATPALVDGGPDAAVELGVKFRSDVDGFVTGIRFYKAAGNTGSHSGSLWSNTGTLLATGAFTTETASGWQQLNFATPVPVTAGTVYVVSYFCPAGHYSADVNFFNGHGVDAPPLHALANGVSGANGVFRYGTSSGFPSQSYNASNYWVDVVFQAGAAPTLSSIAITPQAPTTNAGTTVQFTATGTYSSGSTQDISSQVAWASSNTTRATISASGLAFATSAGTTTISATAGAVSASTLLTIQSAPLAISTASLPQGTVSAAYSATLAAAGGTAPYSWAITSGALPAGLSLNASSGAVTGTPSAAGTFSLTVQVTDSSAPAQVVSKALSLTVTAAPSGQSLWPATTVPTHADGGPDASVELGLKFQSNVAGYISGIRFYKATANTGTHTGSLWTSNGTMLGTGTFVNETASGWQQLIFATPIAITANTVYVASYHASAGHYSADQGYFSGRAVDNGALHGLANGESGGNGVYAYGASTVFPSQNGNTTNYWVDVLFTAGSAPTLVSLAVTPANPTVAINATQQFVATATYSDGQTADRTSQAAWSSSVATVASVGSATGLATGVSAGATTISANIGAVTGSTTLTVSPPILTIGTSVLPGADAGVPYAATLTATGGLTPYAWSIATGTLPAGLTLNPATGMISGTPTAAGTASFTVRVTDATATPQAATKALSITVAAAPTGIAVTPANVSLVIGGTQAFVATATYPGGATQDVSSRATWASTAPNVASIGAGGTASAASIGTTTISATLAGITGSTGLTVLAPPVVISTATLPAGNIGNPYSAGITASGGTAPYTWSVTTGNLPPGLTLNASTGTVSGTPTTAGSYGFTVQAADHGTPVQSASKPLSLVISATSTAVTLWADNVIPTTVDDGPDSPVELGVKFRSDVAGSITGIRFYKSNLNTGVHVANLWSASGVLLASATFVNETASGWQQVQLPTPVPVNANTVYVASYHSLNGHYSGDTNYFAGGGFDHAPLHALASGESGPNGVFRYGTGSTFPTDSWNAANYWVDVVFQPAGGSSGPDTTPPLVSNVSPASGATNVNVAAPIVVTFSEPMDPATINATSIQLHDGANALIPATVAYDSAAAAVTLSPTTELSAQTVYTLTAKGGAGGVKDVSGNALALDFSSSFTTAAADPYGAGPGGPVLVITNAANPFTRYLAEILLTEGLNLFALRELSTVTSGVLAQYDVVVLGETTLSPAQVTMFTNWVNAGGNLIAMRPDKQLASLLGVLDQGATVSNGYLAINTASGPGAGIVADTIQYHGTADRYTANLATPIATLYATAGTSLSSPAVTMRAVGTNGGHAAAFMFDLARSVVLTRQGNPDWAGQDRDGNPPLRTNDLFYGAAAFDPQPDWIDLNKVAIPQADEQQRLLANMILLLNTAKRPLPRFYYFPNGHSAVVVMTGDDHAGGGTAGRFDHYRELKPNASVDDWEAVRSTSYIYPTSIMSDAQAAAYSADGFEIGLHLNTDLAPYTAATGEAMLNLQLDQFRALYPSLPAQVSERVHALAWSGYTIMAELESKYGIRMDTTYYYWPAAWVANRPGFMTGSGMPMRFAMADGRVIDVFQATTQMNDEAEQVYPFTVNTLLDRALGPEGYYGAFVANMHTDTVESAGSDAIIASCLARGVPVISARQLLTWTDARNRSSFGSITWSGNTLAFTVNADPAARGLLVMVPMPAGWMAQNLQVNGAPANFFVRQMKGLQYAVVPGISGTYQMTVAPDTVAPTVTAVTPSPGATGVSVLSAITVGFSEPMDPATMTSAAVRLRDAGNDIVPTTITYDSTSFTVSLSPDAHLAAGQMYQVEVTAGANAGKDLAGNALATAYSSSFTTGLVANPSYSLWPDSAVPAIVNDNDPNAVELGLKFRPSVAGYVTGIRFYKSSQNTGVHVGNLWTGTGVQLASVTFANETAAGWQYQALPSPVPVAANTTYVVSYHTPTGHYSVDSAYFVNGSVVNGPLSGLASGLDGPNGLYQYGASVFPTLSWNSCNYWVDVVFEPTP